MKLETIQISPSILAAALIDLKASLLAMNAQYIDFIHLDVMDGHFVPQLTFGETYSREIQKVTNIPLDIHLMVSKPEQEVPKYFPLKPQILSFHIEATYAPIRLTQSIRQAGIRVGVAISPGTPIERVEPLLDEIDLVLLMSVEPGCYGQKFLTNTLPRIKKLKELITGRKILIEVDGGINDQNIGEVRQAGADIAVSGAFCFRTLNINENVQQLKKASVTV